MAEKKQKEKLRPPIVTLLGHVDHGKTTLLDKIRKTKLQGKEAGGITQAIGASTIKTKENKRITFIDTPGHAAFANMRSQGAKIADIVILVVAADDGVKPQTKEALSYVQDVDVPFIVAVTKIDLETASVSPAKGQLEKMGVLFEGSGGDVPLVAVSGKTGKGIDELLQTISLVAEINEIKGSEKKELDAVVFETGKDQGGPVASVVVRNGVLKAGDEIVAETAEAKVRALFDYTGEKVGKAEPGEAVQVLGFKKLPEVGEVISLKSEKSAIPETVRKKRVQKKAADDEIPVVLRAESAGSLQALEENLPEKVVVVGSGVGEVTDSDVFLAKSAEADIYSFESKVSSRVKKLAKTEGVEINTYKIIYKLFEDLEEVIEEGRVKILGVAKVKDTFPFNNKVVAGCKVRKGRIAKSDTLVLKRGEKEIGEAKITSFKKGKEDIDVAKQGEECGIIFTPQLEFKVGDMLISVRR